MVIDSQTLDSIFDDPFDNYDSCFDAIFRQRFLGRDWARIVASRYPFSVPLSLNRKRTVYALKGQHPVVVKYLPLTKFGHSELHYTRVFSGELGPLLLDVSVLEHGVEMVMEPADMTLSQLPIRDHDHLLAVASDLAFLCYELEQRGLGHYDLKPNNVLCYSQTRDREYLRLADFGFTMPTQRFYDYYFRFPIGTPGYTPPEAYFDDPEQLVLLHSSPENPSCSRSDIFAYGVLLSTLIQGKNGLAGLDRLQLKERMLTGAYRDDVLFFSSCDAAPELMEIIYSCTHPDPRARPTSFGDILCILGDP